MAGPNSDFVCLTGSCVPCHQPCSVPTSSRLAPCHKSALIGSGDFSLSLMFAAATLFTNPSTMPLLLNAVTS